jgi:hypothetical protein
MPSIFSLSAEGFWFASVFCTNMMFCHAGKESISESPQDLVKQGNFEMSVSLWHQHVLVPATIHVTQHHKMPSFAREALRYQNSLGSRNGAIVLHVCLLLHACKDILEQCRGKNVGKKTLEEVHNWFALMSETANSSLFNAAPESLKAKFKELLIEDLPSMEDSNGKQEHPYFSQEILFLRVAHMVYFYCKNNMDSGFPHTKYARIEVNDVDMKNWETLSGELFQHTFRLDSTEPDFDHFAFLKLPYDKLAETLVQSDSPSAAHAHVNVLHAIHEVVGNNFTNSLRSDWETEAPLLELFMPFAKTMFEEKYLPVFSNRKKQRTHYMKKRNEGKVYKPKQRYFFQNDRFIMGWESLYWKTRIARGRASGEFKFVYPESEESDDQSDQV